MFELVAFKERARWRRDFLNFSTFAARLIKRNSIEYHRWLKWIQFSAHKSYMNSDCDYHQIEFKLIIHIAHTSFLWIEDLCIKLKIFFYPLIFILLKWSQQTACSHHKCGTILENIYIFWPSIELALLP